jgi:hypothetical protein
LNSSIIDLIDLDPKKHHLLLLLLAAASKKARTKTYSKSTTSNPKLKLCPMAKSRPVPKYHPHAIDSDQETPR